MDRDEAFQQRQHVVVILEDARYAIGVDGGVIPGRDDLLRGVPGRRYIGVRPLEDGQRLGAVAEPPPLRIGARHVADQGSHLTRLAVD